MIKQAAFNEYKRAYEARIEAAESQLRAMKSGLKHAEMCLRYALTTSDPDFKQWLLWRIVAALDVDQQGLFADPGSEPGPSHWFWKACDSTQKGEE
jgi:phage major head subunit gpT-like protein